MNKHKIQEILTATAYDNKGDKLGSVSEVFVDENTGRPTFVEVNHGLFGLSSSLVPLRGHRLNGDELVLAFEKDRISDAPDFDSEIGLDTAKQEEIYRHYAVADVQDEVAYEEAHDAGAAADLGADLGAGLGANLDTDDAIVRSEEQMHVGKERVATETVKLRKYVVTDTETVEVPVTREEVRIERTPISAEEAATMGDHEFGEEEASVTLHEERVQVTKETVPVEKISLHKEEITDTAQVSEELRKERIETEGVDDAR